MCVLDVFLRVNLGFWEGKIPPQEIAEINIGRRTTDFHLTALDRAVNKPPVCALTDLCLKTPDFSV